MITSPNNEKLKLIRKLRERKHREREGLFVTEGEDLLEAGLAAGAEPEMLLSAASSGLGGVEVEPSLLAELSTLGSGTRAIAIWRERWTQPAGPVCVYLHAVGDPGNVGAVIRSAHALVEGAVVLGPGCADPHSPKAVRASMGSIFGQPLARGTVDETPRPRVGNAGATAYAVPRRRARGPARGRARRLRGELDGAAAHRWRRVAERRRRGCDRPARDIVARRRAACLSGLDN
jgi:RNA methyltransferase, TrmH family